jgi:hypothetical protein
VLEADTRLAFVRNFVVRVVPLEGETLNSLFETMAAWNEELKEIKDRSSELHWPEP